MQRWRQLGPVIVLAVAPAATAQIIPWDEPPAVCRERTGPADPAAERRREPTTKTRTQSDIPW